MSSKASKVWRLNELRLKHGEAIGRRALAQQLGEAQPSSEMHAQFESEIAKIEEHMEAVEAELAADDGDGLGLLGGVASSHPPPPSPLERVLALLSALDAGERLMVRRRLDELDRQGHNGQE